ncbi:MAG TPA: methyltransferase domain-containing protein [Planctomycetaceae bacterium]|nr:methyltransferase domain-containing protein [Planctomycetaceae bacterium]
MIKDYMLRQLNQGTREALRILRSEVRVMRMHRRGVRKAAEWHGATGLKLHFGCGGNLKPGFVNIDLANGADLTLDLREKLPFADDSCLVIYSEHFLEHIDYPNGAHALLRECYRVLQPGGTFSVGVPDTEWPLLEYAGQRNDGYFNLVKQQWHPEWCKTRLEHINFHFRQGTEHKFAYDFETMESLLKSVGFTDVKRRACNPGLDQSSWAVGTLYVDAVKS